MTKWISIILNVLGIGSDALNNRAKLKKLKVDHEFKILEAETAAKVDRIKSNTATDNDIDLETVKQKAKTWKDDVITYTIFMPVLMATASPFILAFSTGVWVQLSDDIQKSYENLDHLPAWYHYALFLVLIDVLGFRSFARKIVDKYVFKK